MLFAVPTWSTLLFIAQNLTTADVYAARFQRAVFSWSPGHGRTTNAIAPEACFDSQGIPCPLSFPNDPILQGDTNLGLPIYSNIHFPSERSQVEGLESRDVEDLNQAKDGKEWIQSMLRQRTHEILGVAVSDSFGIQRPPNTTDTTPPDEVNPNAESTPKRLVSRSTTPRCRDPATAGGQTSDVAVANAAQTTASSGTTSQAWGCFPALGFRPPSTVPSSLDGWWCDDRTEYGFLGFSYPVQNCETREGLTRDFKDIRERFKGRYVRLYAACDRAGFYDDVIEAAWTTGIGVHALIWFGWDDPDAWRRRRDALFSSIKSNPKARFVTRVVQFGSEPLYDSALAPNTLINEIQSGKASLNIPFTISDLRYGYTKLNNPTLVRNLLSSIDVVHAHILPFFAQNVASATGSWPLIKQDLDWFMENGGGKKVFFSQTGWPSVTSPGISPNSPNAVASVADEKAFFDLLDSQCKTLKATGRGVGWFAHFYSDEQGPGYGIYNNEGTPKFDFSPRTSC